MTRPFAIALIFAIGTIASQILAAHTPTRFAIDRAQPLPVATAWGNFGGVTLALLVVMLVAAFVPYLALLRRPPRIRVTLAAIAASLVCGALFTPVFSSDVYAYAAYGEMARIGLNPYAHNVLPSHDALFAAVTWQWPQLPVCVYGEAFVALARAAVSTLHATSVATVLATFRILASLALVISVALCACIGVEREQRRFAAVFIGCNPIVLWSAIEGHNDTIMLALVLASIAIARRSTLSAVVVAAFAAAVKLPAALAAAILALRSFGRSATVASASLIATVLIIAAAYFRWFEGLRTTLAPHGHYLPLASVSALPWSLATAVAPTNSSFATIASIAWALVAAALIASRARSERGIDRLLALALALWVLVPNPYPWYGLWVLPLAAFSREPRLRGCALAVTALALLRYLPDAVAVPSLAINAAMGLLAVAPFLATLAPSKRAIITGSS